MLKEKKTVTRGAALSAPRPPGQREGSGRGQGCWGGWDRGEGIKKHIEGAGAGGTEGREGCMGGASSEIAGR